jgi:hypothetical protein
MSILDVSYFKKIPNDIMINNILPYTYQKQNDKLLADILSFRKDIDLVNVIYTTQFNYNILLFDLINYFDVKTILLRNYSIYNNLIPNKKLSSFSERFFDRKKIITSILFFWGLLTIYERARFINKFVLFNYEFFL